MALERIPGDKARRYRDTETGAIVSRHAAEIKPRLTRLGYDDAHQRADARRRFGYANGGRGLADKQERQWNAARKEGFSKRKDGELSKLLVSIGVRDAAADYDVGETPK